MMFLLNNNDGCMTEPPLRDGMKFEDFTTDARYAEYKVIDVRQFNNPICMGYVVCTVLGNPRDYDNCINAVKQAGFSNIWNKAEFIKFVN
jgi:hypothetical protein